MELQLYTLQFYASMIRLGRKIYMTQRYVGGVVSEDDPGRNVAASTHKTF